MTHLNSCKLLVDNRLHFWVTKCFMHVYQLSFAPLLHRQQMQEAGG